jgi:hypothetical protein
LVPLLRLLLLLLLLQGSTAQQPFPIPVKLVT